MTKRSKAKRLSPSSDSGSEGARRRKKLKTRTWASPECTICMDAPVQTTFIPCGHQAACFHCSQHFNKKPCPIGSKRRRLFCAHIKHGCHTTLSTTRCCLASEVCVTVPRSQCVLVSAHCHICLEFSLGCQGFCLQLGGVHPLRASPKRSVLDIASASLIMRFRASRLGLRRCS